MRRVLTMALVAGLLFGCSADQPVVGDAADLPAAADGGTGDTREETASADIPSPDFTRGSDAADVEIPDVAKPDLDTPDVAIPDLVESDLVQPDLDTPDVAIPDLAEPDLVQPDLVEPDFGCLPDCAGKVCGGDGCGGSCGLCPDGTKCSDGACLLLPWCPGGGVAGHLKHVAAYWVASTAYGSHFDEVAGALTAAHASPNSLAGLPAGTRVIVDVVWYLFKPGQGTVNPNIESSLDSLENLLAGMEDRVAAFYVFDEPYLDSHQASRTVLETGIAALKERFPGIPAYVTFAHHCFDPSVFDPACDELAASDKGIPANLDWVSFDWYSDGSCGQALEQQFQCHVVEGVNRLEALHDGDIILTGEGLDLFVGEEALVEMAHRFFGLARERPQVTGVDWFLWADVPDEGFLGITSMPVLRAVVRGLAQTVRTSCGEAADVVPVFEWYAGGCPDHRYEPGYWVGWESTPYRPRRLAFGLLPADDPGTVPLYSCPIDRGNGCVDHYLTKNAECDGVPLAAPATVIGNIHNGAADGLVALHRFTQVDWPWDHVYTTDPNWSGEPGEAYLHDFVIGHVVPPESI